MFNIPKLFTFSTAWPLIPVCPQTRSALLSLPTSRPSAVSVRLTSRMYPEAHMLCTSAAHYPIPSKPPPAPAWPWLRLPCFTPSVHPASLWCALPKSARGNLLKTNSDHVIPLRRPSSVFQAKVQLLIPSFTKYTQNFVSLQHKLPPFFDLMAFAHDISSVSADRSP